jgi:Leucine-rich repeat (LRR) protein
MSEPFKFLPHERQAGERLLKLQCKWRVNVLYGGFNHQGEIVRIDFAHVAKCSRRDLESLVDLQALEEIQVSGPFDCDGLLAVAAKLPKLREIRLEDGDEGELTDQGVAHLTGHPALEQLELLRSSLTDATLHSLSTVRSLDSLEIWGRGFTNAGAKSIAKLVNLQSLDLQSSTIDDVGLAELASLSQLYLLSLEKSAIRGSGCAAWANSKKLKSLFLRESRVDDAGLKSVAQLPQLETLFLSHNPITDAGLKHLSTGSGLRKLNTLLLEGTQITGKGVAHLAKLPKLKLLDLAHCPLDTKYMAQFGKCAQIKTLQLENTTFGQAERIALKKRMPKCMIDVSNPKGNEPDEALAPWNKPEYFWKHPPECLQGFKLTRTKDQERSEGEVSFQLACRCGHKKGEILGHPLTKVASEGKKKGQPGDLFVGPLAFRCHQCGATTSIIDTDEHGYNAQIGSSATYRGEGEPEVYACPKCAKTVWQV